VAVLERLKRFEEGGRRWVELIMYVDRSAESSKDRQLAGFIHFMYAQYLTRRQMQAESQYRVAASLLEQARDVDLALDALGALAKAAVEQGDTSAAEAAYVERVAVVRRARCLSPRVKRELLEYATFLRSQNRLSDSLKFENEVASMSNEGFRSTCSPEGAKRVPMVSPDGGRVRERED
jgi:hypothetical protein